MDSFPDDDGNTNWMVGMPSLSSIVKMCFRGVPRIAFVGLCKTRTTVSSSSSMLSSTIFTSSKVEVLPAMIMTLSIGSVALAD